MKYIVEVNIKRGMRANCKMIDDACCIDLKNIFEEFYKKQTEITKRLEERERNEL